MDTRLLRSFLAVARAGSFTDAAVELGYTQSTVTAHVQKLEQQLGSRLLDRLPSGVVVTDLGARITTHADDVLLAEERLRALAQEPTIRPAGTVRLIAPESLCTYRLPAVIGAVRAAEPDVRIWVTPGGLGDALDAVRRGTVDLALTMEPHAPVTDLTMETIGTEPLLLLDHEAPRDDAPVTWSELATRDALLIEEGCGYSDDVADHLAATGAGLARRSRFGSIEAIKRCAAVGLGWTVLPAISVESEIRTGDLHALDGPNLPRCDIRLATHPRRHHGPALEVVRNELRRAWQ